MILKAPEEIQVLRQANRIVACILEELAQLVTPGALTRDLDRFVEERIRAMGGEPAFLGYRGYPASSCISINEQVVHGIPGNRRIREGDLVSVDLGVIYKGYYGDAARTYGVGKLSQKARRLMQVTEEPFTRA